MPAISLRAALAGAALAVGATLFAALASEWWGGMVPCALCLVGRWPYWVAIGLALLGLVGPRGLAMLSAAGVVAAMLASAAIGVVHVGVEAKWWPSPLQGCVARFTPGGDLPARPAKPCDEPAYFFAALPVSMAAMSLMFSLGSAAALGAVLYRTTRTRPS